MRVVEVGRYFVTRNASDFQHTIACREYTLHETTNLLNQKGGSEETRELDLYWKSRQAFSTSSGVVAVRSKAKAKPQPRESTGTTTIPLSERVWIDIEPSKQDLESYNLSKKVINLLRHNQKLHREEDGAIQFYKIGPMIDG